MVLFKRKTIQFEPPTYVDADDDVWWIEATGEFFKTYDEYLARMDFYLQKRFICEVTGHSCLTLFEALHSELEGSKEVIDAFPEHLKEPVLRRIQLSTISRLDALVDTLFVEFKKEFFPGEVVVAAIEATSKSTERIPVIIREKAKFNAITLESGEIQPAVTKYRVQTESGPVRFYVCNESQLTRDRRNFTKMSLKTFVKYSAKKENWSGAPWLVRPEYAQKYRIDQTVPVQLTQYRGNPSPEELRQQRHKDKLKAQKDRQEMIERQKRLFENKEKVAAEALVQGLGGLREQDVQAAEKPQNGDDSVVKPAGASENVSTTLSTTVTTVKTTVSSVTTTPIKTVVSTVATAPTEKPSPPPKQVIKEDLEYKLDGGLKKPVFHFDKLYPSNVTDVCLEVWVFINVYKEVLVLDSFTYDDFIDALRYDAESELLAEIHCSLLSQIVGPNSDSLLVEYPEESDDSDDEEYDEDEENEDEGTEENGTTGVKREEVGVKVKEEAKEVEVEGEEDEEEEEDEDEDADEDKKSSSPSVENKAASFAVFKGVDWKTRLRRRNFKDGGWQVVLIGLLYNLTYYEPWEDFLNGCLDVWAPAKAPTTMASARSRYFELDFTQKAKILQILCNLIHPTEAVRNYIDKCMTRVTELRRDKVDKQREYKVILDEIRVLELEVRKVQAELEEEEKKKKKKKDESSTEEAKEETKEKIKKESKETKEAKDAEAVEEMNDEEPPAKKPKTSDMKEQLETLKDKIKERQENLKGVVASINTKEEEIRFADVNRLRLLGKDRFYNRYWWFEGNGIEDATVADEKEGTGFTMGRLWIQGPFEDEIKFCLTGDIIDTKRKVEGEGFLKDHSSWGFLEHPRELGALLKWLNQWGSREHKLKRELMAVSKKIKASMVSRLEDLGREDELNLEDKVKNEKVEEKKEEMKKEEEDNEAKREDNGKGDIQNGSSKDHSGGEEQENEEDGKEEDDEEEEDDEFDRVCAWSNGHAVAKLGHSHYEGPPKKSGRKEIKKKKK